MGEWILWPIEIRKFRGKINTKFGQRFQIILFDKQYNRVMEGVRGHVTKRGTIVSRSHAFSEKARQTVISYGHSGD